SIVILIFIYMTTLGMIITSTFTLGMAKQGHRARSASAVLGMLPMLLGSVFSPLAGINEASPVLMAAILFTTSLIWFIAFFTLLKIDGGDVLNEFCCPYPFCGTDINPTDSCSWIL